MHQWIRLYKASMHNPKIVTLNDRQHRGWHNCLLMADETGTLPKMRDMACHMRMTVQEAEQILCELVEAGLIDIVGIAPARVFKMHDWNTHQYVSDNSTERVKKFRNKNKAAGSETAMKRFSNGGVTPPDSESETDTDTENKLQLSNQEPARDVKVKSELGFNFSSKSGLGSGRGMETLLRQAEGLGLDVQEIIQITNKNRPKKREGYFVTLCVNRLKDKLPGLDEQIIRDALNGKFEQYKAVCSILAGVP